MKTTIIVCFFILFLSSNVKAQEFNIYSDFPSGNIIIDKIKNDTVWIRPDLRDTKGEWFYWCFAVNKAKDKTLTFVFTKPNIFTIKGPAISFDLGFNWEWLYPLNAPTESFSYTFRTDSEVRFSMGMPYTQKQFDLFIQPFLKYDFVKLDTLAKTKSGRVVKRLFIKPINSESKYKVLITARHHACEMMASYEMEGIIRKILNDEWLRNNIEFCIIPFMDIDGVENGDQGKNRFPRDHNRDYDNTSIYTSTAALRSWVPTWAENKLVIALDLHCPWIKGNDNENIYIVGSSNENLAAQEKLFCSLLKTCNKGELKISEKIYYPSNYGWNTSANYKDGLSFVKWASSLYSVKLSCSIEFPFGSNEGQTITQENTRVFGEDLAVAIKKYLKQY